MDYHQDLRTVELTALLTFGYIAKGIFMVILTLIVIITVFNDVETIILAVDYAWSSKSTEKWNITEITWGSYLWPLDG